MLMRGVSSISRKQEARTFWHKQFISMRGSHCDVLGARLVTRRESARGCSNDENGVRVELGDVGCEVMK